MSNPTKKPKPPVEEKPNISISKIINEKFEKKLVELVSEYYRIPTGIIYHLSPYMSDTENYIKINFPAKAKAEREHGDSHVFYTDKYGKVEKNPGS